LRTIRRHVQLAIIAASLPAADWVSGAQNMTDYRDLLIRYMALVCHEAGTTLLEKSDATALRPTWFTVEEFQAISELSDECYVEDVRMEFIEAGNLRKAGRKRR
jgi:hypothetical protein